MGTRSAHQQRPTRHARQSAGARLAAEADVCNGSTCGLATRFLRAVHSALDRAVIRTGADVSCRVGPRAAESVRGSAATSTHSRSVQTGVTATGVVAGLRCGAARWCIRSPCGPKTLKTSAGCTPVLPNQCGTRVSNSATSPMPSTTSWPPRMRRIRPDRRTATRSRRASSVRASPWSSE